MLPDQATHVGAVAARLAAEARRVGRVPARQVGLLQRLLAVDVGERHLGRRDEEEIPVAGDLEQVLLELGQVAGAGERGAIDQERRLDFRVPVLARVQVEHEADERAGQACAGAQQQGEPGAGHPHRPLEVDDAERRSEVPMRLRFEVELAGRSPASDLDVVVGALAHRDALVRRVGQREQQRRTFLFERRELRVERLDLVGALTAGSQQLRGVLTRCAWPARSARRRGCVRPSGSPRGAAVRAGACRVPAGDRARHRRPGPRAWRRRRVSSKASLSWAVSSMLRLIVRIPGQRRRPDACANVHERFHEGRGV